MLTSSILSLSSRSGPSVPNLTLTVIFWCEPTVNGVSVCMQQKTTKNELKRWFTPRDTLQTIDLNDCIFNRFYENTTTLLKLKQSQYLIRGTTRPEYAGTIMNLQIVLNAQKNYLLKSRYPKKHLPKLVGVLTT